jgi:squalene cyclase
MKRDWPWTFPVHFSFVEVAVIGSAAPSPNGAWLPRLTSPFHFFEGLQTKSPEDRLT